MYEEAEGDISLGSWGIRGWSVGSEKVDGLGSSEISTSELLKLEMVSKTVCVESSESLRGELEKEWL